MNTNQINSEVDRALGGPGAAVSRAETSPEGARAMVGTLFAVMADELGLVAARGGKVDIVVTPKPAAGPDWEAATNERDRLRATAEAAEKLWVARQDRLHADLEAVERRATVAEAEVASLLANGNGGVSPGQHNQVVAERDLLLGKVRRLESKKTRAETYIDSLKREIKQMETRGFEAYDTTAVRATAIRDAMADLARELLGQAGPAHTARQRIVAEFRRRAPSTAARAYRDEGFGAEAAVVLTHLANYAAGHRLPHAGNCTAAELSAALTEEYDQLRQAADAMGNVRRVAYEAGLRSADPRFRVEDAVVVDFIERKLAERGVITAKPGSVVERLREERDLLIAAAMRQGWAGGDDARGAVDYLERLAKCVQARYYSASCDPAIATRLRDELTKCREECKRKADQCLAMHRQLKRVREEANVGNAADLNAVIAACGGEIKDVQMQLSVDPSDKRWRARAVQGLNGGDLEIEGGRARLGGREWVVPQQAAFVRLEQPAGGEPLLQWSGMDLRGWKECRRVR